MLLTAAKAKSKIKNIAHKNNADPRVLMRIYMMERFLERISMSDYKENNEKQSANRKLHRQITAAY